MFVEVCWVLATAYGVKRFPFRFSAVPLDNSGRKIVIPCEISHWFSFRQTHGYTDGKPTDFTQVDINL